MHQLYLLCCVLCISSFALVQPLVGQKQSAPKPNCERITQETLPKVVSLLNNNNYSEMEQVLQTIEGSCGSNEITQRLRIIGQLIQKQPTNTSIRDYLQQGKDNELMIRLDNAADDNYQNIYRKNKATYHFVPLRHTIDSLIQVKAAAIIGSNSYALNETEEAIAYLFSDHISTYLMRTQKEKPATRIELLQEVEEYKKGWGFTIGAGLYRPVYATNPIFNNQAIFSIAAISPISEDWIYDFYLKIRSNKGSRPFDYDLYGDLVEVKSPLNYTLGTSVGYKLLDKGKFMMIGKGGIGFESIITGFTDIYSTGYNDIGEEDFAIDFNNVDTFNLSTGLSVMQHLRRRTFIGAQVQYHFSPHNIDRRLLTPITAHYTSFEVFFRF